MQHHNRSIILMICISVCPLVEGALWPPDGWRMPSTIVDQPNQQKFPEIYVKGDTIHAIWVDNRDNTYRLFYQRSTDAGFTWGGDQLLSANNEAVPSRKRNFSISGRDGYVYVVYDVENATHNLTFIRSTNNGDTWGDKITLEAGMMNYPDPSIYASPDSIRVAYCKYPYIYYCASGTDNSQWNYDYINSSCIPQQCPDITVVNNQPNITFVINDIINGERYGHTYHAKTTSGAWVVTNILTGMNPTEYVFPHINADIAGNLYVVFEDTLRTGPLLGYIIAYYSTNGGTDWIGGGLSPQGREGTDFITLGGDSILITSGDNENVYGQIVLFSENGCEVRDPFLISSEYTDPPTCKPHTCVAQGRFARHLLFHTSYANVQNITYIANEDTMLSDAETATALNNGRHLFREPFSGRLHAVYTSQGRVHYTVSGDAGSTWAPYHILEDLASGSKESGEYPSIGLVPGFLWANPCVVYRSNNEIKYRYQDGSAAWQGFTVLAEESGLTPGIPVVATYDDQVYVAFPVTNWLPTQYMTAVLLYKFNYDAAGPSTPVILDQSLSDILYDSKVSLTIDGDGHPHCVWEKKTGTNDNEEIYYSWFDGSNWSSPLLISQQPDFRSITPDIDCYGPLLSVVWCNADLSEIWRRQKDIYGNWMDAIPYSEQNAIAEYPVNAANDFSIWCENPSNQFDIRFRSDTWGFGWVCQDAQNEFFCHSQLQRDYSPWDLFTIFTKGDAIPYRIIFNRQQFGGGGGTESPYYTVETGLIPASPFCMHRDSTINYGNYHVDYGRSTLAYRLSLLDPAFPNYKIKGTSYFTGGSDKIHELWVNGVKKATFRVKSNQENDFEVLIPRELYRNDHRITLEIKSPNNSGVYLSGLKVYRVISEGNKGGVQSLTDGMIQTAELIASPNPFINELLIKPVLSANNGSDIGVTIYDVSGRIVKSIYRSRTEYRISPTIRWDGRDQSGYAIPAGIYFIRMKINDWILIEKVLKLR